MADQGNADHYVDRRVFQQWIGFAEVLALPAERVLVSTYLGRCFIVNLERGTLSAEPEPRPPKLLLPVGQCLASLSRSVGSPPTCAVASRSGWASVWNLGGQATVQVYPKNGGPVNAVAMSPRGDRVALGTGYYPLDPGVEPKAVVELWDTTDLRVCRAARRLPGVVVDRLAWDATGTHLLVTTGAITQNRGHVASLDGHTLALLDIAEVDSCNCRALHLNRSTGWAILLYRHGVEVRSAEELALREHFWAVDEEAYGADLTADGNEVFLTNGLRIDLWSGESWKRPALPDCTSVAVRSDGGGLGISQDGILRVWRD